MRSVPILFIDVHAYLKTPWPLALSDLATFATAYRSTQDAATARSVDRSFFNQLTDVDAVFQKMLASDMPLTAHVREALADVGSQLYTVTPENDPSITSPTTTAIKVTHLGSRAIERYSAASGAAIAKKGSAVAHLIVLFNRYDDKDSSRQLDFNYKTASVTFAVPLSAADIHSFDMNDDTKHKLLALSSASASASRRKRKRKPSASASASRKQRRPLLLFSSRGRRRPLAGGGSRSTSSCRRSANSARCP